MMKQMFSLSLAVMISATALSATVDGVILRQQWPHSDEMEVNYILSGVASPVDVDVSFYDGEMPLTGAMVAGGQLKGDVVSISSGGAKSFRFRPVEVFGASMPNVIENLRVKIEPVATRHPNSSEVVYKILSLDRSGSVPCEDVTRADILNGRYGSYETDYSRIGPGFATSLDDVLIWTGVTNDIAYKTTKLVLRKIPAAGKSFLMGPGSDPSAQATVSFSNDFWMAVFETTAYQHRLMYRTWIDSNYSYTAWESQRAQIVDGSVTASDVTPADYLGWSGIRAHQDSSSPWPASGHDNSYDWYQIGRLRVMSGGKLFDLPTSAEWEFAARAGTTTPLPSGKDSGNVDADYAEIGRTWLINCKAASSEPGNPNDADTQAGFPTSACSLEYGCNMVGQYRPNAYGLYDMMGNACEWCLDYRNTNVDYKGTYDGKDDPKGPADPTWPTSPDRVARGGSYRIATKDVGVVSQSYAGARVKDFGYRICLHEANK